MAGRPPAGDPVLRALRSGRGGRTGVAGVAAGDEVFALTPFDRDGVAADYAAVPAELLVAKPRTLEHAESAAIPLPALTAWQGLFDHGRLARRRARADPRCRGRGRRLRGAARPRARRARDRDRIGGETRIWSASSAHTRPSTRRRALRGRGGARRRRVRHRRRRAVAPVPRGAAAGGRLVSVAEEPPDGGVYFIVEPNRDQLGSLARLVDAGELRPPPSRSSRSRRRARRSRAAWSRAGEARWCWRSGPASQPPGATSRNKGSRRQPDYQVMIGSWLRTRPGHAARPDQNGAARRAG